MKIKICGLTGPNEAAYINKNHIDYAGMVLFFPKSKRNITISQAQEIMKALEPAVKTVAVMVSPTLQQVQQAEAAGFDYVQLHGEIIPEILSDTKIPILKAFNIKDMPMYPQYRDCDRIIGYVFDAQEPGSGTTFDWSLVKQLPKDDKLLLLAGGLSPENVAQAITYLQPDGVDVSSGVEYTDRPGKNPALVDAFAAAVRQCCP